MKCAHSDAFVDACSTILGGGTCFQLHLCFFAFSRYCIVMIWISSTLCFLFTLHIVEGRLHVISAIDVWSDSVNTLSGDDQTLTRHREDVV